MMTPRSAAAIAKLLIQEGDTFVAEDMGRGACRWGITLATAKALGLWTTPEQIKALTRDDATQFYQKYYWEQYRLEEIEGDSLAMVLLSLIVNLGSYFPVKWLQRAAGVYPDGILGGRTIQAVDTQGSAKLLPLLRLQAIVYYETKVFFTPSEKPLLAGWLARLDG
jgi:lysozyme family protein